MPAPDCSQPSPVLRLTTAATCSSALLSHTASFLSPDLSLKRGADVTEKGTLLESILSRSLASNKSTDRYYRLKAFCFSMYLLSPTRASTPNDTGAISPCASSGLLNGHRVSEGGRNLRKCSKLKRQEQWFEAAPGIQEAAHPHSSSHSWLCPMELWVGSYNIFQVKGSIGIEEERE